MAQSGVAYAAETLGARIIPISHKKFSEDYWNQMNHHIDGALAKLYHGDIVIMQYPSYMNIDFDARLADKIRLYSNIKLVIFVEDLQSLLYGIYPEAVTEEIAIFNKADLLILPSVKAKDFLVSKGLNPNIPVLTQTIWEMESFPLFTSHNHLKRMCFSGDADRFTFIKAYNGHTPIHHFSRLESENPNATSLIHKGFYEPKKLMKELSNGGYGLVWCDKEYFDLYYHMNQPHKLGFFIAAGMPVIVQKGCAHEEFVRKNGLGYAVNSLEEADTLIQHTSDEDYRKMLDNVSNIQFLSIHGMYTKRLLSDAIISVMNL